MKKPRKRLDRPSFWKWAIPLVLGLVVLAILGRSGAVRLVREFATGLDAAAAITLALTAMGLVRLVLTVLLAMALARRFRDIGWPAWIGPTILLFTTLGPPFFVFVTYVNDIGNNIRELVSMAGWISASVDLVLLIVAGSVPGKASAQNIEVAHVFD
jgi:uncharacterized membrane protein YhaH (DUF805 family)